jgi:tetratricopeptide (TPR) repeat protein
MMFGAELILVAALAGATSSPGGPVEVPHTARSGGASTFAITVSAGDAGGGSLLLSGELGPALTVALQRVTPSGNDRGWVAAPAIVRAGYWGALEQLSRREYERACETLVRLEAPASESLRPEAMDVLRGAQLDLARRLAEIAGESLYPIVALHEEMSVQYLRRDHARLAAHSVEMATQLASLYASGERGAAHREDAAGTLAALAGEIARQGNPEQLRRLLEAALAIDPESEPALLFMAVHLERYGRPEEAVAVLRRLVAAHPECHEGALRLAVCLRRSGRQTPDGLLKSCLETAAPEWVRAVAFDELARRAADGGDWKAAVAVLSDAVRTLPEVTGLRIELAHAYDRDHRPRAALDVVRGLASEPPASRPSPRFIYSQVVPEAVKRERARLAERTTLRLAALAGALARTMAPPEE